MYVVDLGPTLRPSAASAPEANGRELIWVDKNTFFVLKHGTVQHAGRPTAAARDEVTEVQYNPTLDAALFTFIPPAAARSWTIARRHCPRLRLWKAQRRVQTPMAWNRRCWMP